MARLVKHTEKAPVQVDTTGAPVFVCRCGLTRNEKGFCDGSHHKTKDEEDGKVYCYDENLNREEEKECDCWK